MQPVEHRVRPDIGAYDAVEDGADTGVVAREIRGGFLCGEDEEVEFDGELGARGEVGGFDEGAEVADGEFRVFDDGREVGCVF